ncbi:MAG: serine/threonine protein kinase [Clostridia bacterium]|nr:serine/threonine protein kinase [Clostridia bacterium]
MERRDGPAAETPEAPETVGEYLKRFFTVYQPVGQLSEKEQKKVLIAEHKKMKSRIVLRSLPQSVPLYDFLCTVRHPNLPEIYDTVKCSDGEIVLEEYIKGLNVAQVIETGLYSYRAAKSLLLDVCSALQLLHRNGFVHRDIKPENIMISDEGGVKLIDFDAARRFNVSKIGDTVALGTIGFAPPEQFGIAQSGPRSDIYALGVLFNVMLTGTHPSEELTGGKAGRIVLRCTQITPEKRFQSLESFMRAL